MSVNFNQVWTFDNATYIKHVALPVQVWHYEQVRREHRQGVLLPQSRYDPPTQWQICQLPNPRRSHQTDTSEQIHSHVYRPTYTHTPTRLEVGPSWHFHGRLKNTPSLLSWDKPHRYVWNTKPKNTSYKHSVISVLVGTRKDNGLLSWPPV